MKGYSKDIFWQIALLALLFGSILIDAILSDDQNDGTSDLRVKLFKELVRSLIKLCLKKLYNVLKERVGEPDSKVLRKMAELVEKVIF